MRNVEKYSYFSSVYNEIVKHCPNKKKKQSTDILIN